MSGLAREADPDLSLINVVHLTGLVGFLAREAFSIIPLEEIQT
jgi:hypothetical protein